MSDCGIYRAMGDGASGLTEQDYAELCALADGTLPSERRAAVGARVAASPELRELVERQRRAVAATRALADEPLPASLRAGVPLRRDKARSRRAALLPRLGLAGAAAAALAIVVLLLSGGPGGPQVADAARFATQPPSAPPPAAAGGDRLALDVEGVVFPDLRRPYGWRAVGTRSGKLDGRRAEVVHYGKEARRIAYVIVGGSALPRPSAGSSVVVDGVRYQTLRLADRPAVTWRRSGRTCVLIGTAPLGELLRLASY